MNSLMDYFHWLCAHCASKYTHRMHYRMPSLCALQPTHGNETRQLLHKHCLLNRPLINHWVSTANSGATNTPFNTVGHRRASQCVAR